MGVMPLSQFEDAERFVSIDERLGARVEPKVTAVVHRVEPHEAKSGHRFESRTNRGSRRRHWI